MSPTELREYLSVLKEAGVRNATVPVGQAGDSLVVEWAPDASAPPVSASPFVDKDGKPVNLDEGMPDLARDDIAAANFEPKQPA